MTEQPPVVAVSVIVHGRVQGVLFRDSCRQEAQEVGACGWVSNERDGTVQAVFEGSREAIDHMVDWVKSGPPHAQVDRVETSPADPTGLTSFEVR